MWTHPAIELLLSELRKRKSLYDQRHTDYLNREKRRQCFQSICKVLLDKEELEATVEEVKSKIQVLRSQLNKELRYMARSKKYVPKLWCFKKMEFLKPYCGMRTSNAAIPPTTISTRLNALKKSVDQMETTSTSTLGTDVPSSSNILTSKEPETEAETNNVYHDMNGHANQYLDGHLNGSYHVNNDVMNHLTHDLSQQASHDASHHASHDINQEFFDTIALTQQIVRNRMAAKLHKAEAPPENKKLSSWEGDLVKSQLDLITDETIRSDTMWEIQCVLRRGIEQDRVLPKRRRNRRPSIAISEISAVGSCISLDSIESTNKDTPITDEKEATELIK